jgi:tetratricopeptide (TPR) repeat protein
MAYGRILDDLRDALAWTGTEAANRSLRIRLTLAGILLWNHFSLTEECRAHVSRAVDDLESAGLTGTSYEMKLKLWLGSSMMVTQDFKPDTLGAMRRALQIATQADDTEYRLRCLSAIALYDLWTGGHQTALRTLEEFVTVAAAGDPSALPEGEVHTAIAELFLGRLQDASDRLERLRQQDLRYFEGSYNVRYLADTLGLLENVLSHVQWLRGFPDTAARTAEAALQRAHPDRHHLSFNNALNYGCALAFWSGRDGDCERFVDMLTQHVKQHGIVARRPVAMFYGAALACKNEASGADCIQELFRAVEEFRSINHLTRMGYYLGVLAAALASRGHLDEAEAAIRDAVGMARTQGEGWCLPEVLRIQASIAHARGRTQEAEAILGEALSVAQETGALSWELRAANDLARIWCTQARPVEARAMLAKVYEAFTEGFETSDLQVSAKLLAALPRA